MAVDKNFVVKNGLEVKSNLIVADTSLDSVGIGTSYIKEKLHVIGGVGATTLYVGGIGTVHVAVGNTARYDNISISGISTASEVTVLGITSTKNLTVSGVSTFQTGFTTNLTAQSLSVTGVSTFAGAIADATITSLTAPTGVSTNFTATNLRVTGITTLTGNATVGTGITMYASAGIVSATELFAEGIKVSTAVTATSFTGNITGDVTGDVSGNSGTFTVTANNSANETVFPVFVDGATGSQGAESDTGFNYNPNTGNLTAGKFTGDGSGLTDLSLGGEFSWIRNQTGIGTASNVGLGTTSAYNALTVVGNASISGVATVTGAITASGGVTGDVTGNADTATTATTATNVTVTANNSANETVYPIFVDGATGNQGAESDTGLFYNPSTGKLTATEFAGDGSNLSGIDATTVKDGGGTIRLEGNTSGVKITGIATASGGFVGALTGNVTGDSAGTHTGAVDLNGGVLTLDADADTTITADTDDQIDIAFGGSDRITLSTGLIDLKNSGSKSAIRLYCESSNAHYTAVEAAAHSAYSGNATVTLPAATDTLVGRDTTDTLTNKTLTSPTITGTGSIAGTFTGNVTGNASGSSGSCTGNSATATEATNVTVTANNSANETVYPIFVDGATGTQGAETDSGLNYNPSTGVLTTTSVTGNLTGNVTGNCTGSSGSCTGNSATATNADVADACDVSSISTNATYYPVFTDNNGSGKTLGVDAGLGYNPSTNVLTSTFSGNITGNVTGNCTGSSGSCTGNSATATNANAADTIDTTSTNNNSTNYLTFVDSSGSVSGETLRTYTNLTCNPSSGTITATEFVGGGAGITGIAAGGSGEFNTSISGATQYDVTNSMATAYTANASTSHRTIVHSIHVCNISGSDVTVSGEMQSSFSIANTVPVPSGSAVELLKQPKVLGPSETIELQCSANSSLEATIVVEYKEDTDYWDAQVDLTSGATLTDVYTSSSNPSVVQSILLANDSGTYDVKARVAWTDGSNNIQSYLVYDMVIPADATVEICEKPKYLASGYKLRAYANQADRLEVTASGKQIT